MALGLAGSPGERSAQPRGSTHTRRGGSRPTVAEVGGYRSHVDEQMARLFDAACRPILDRVGDTLVLGLNHEQQHQELILTDLKHALALNPVRPVYRPPAPARFSPAPRTWLSFEPGVVEISYRRPGFAFDNETPRHPVYLTKFELANRLVTNAEYQDFMADGGYRRPELWLSDGWATRQAGGSSAPLYWEKHDGAWFSMTLAGFRAVDPNEPVCHVSFYEADAFARWAAARLPTEAEWETAVASVPLGGHFLESGHFLPWAGPARDERGPLFQLYGDV